MVLLSQICVSLHRLGVVRTIHASVAAAITPFRQVFFGHDTIAFRRQLIVNSLYQAITKFDILFHPFLFWILDFRFWKNVKKCLSNCRIVELSNRRIVELSNLRIVELSNCRIVELSNCRIVELSNCRIVELSNCRIVESSNCRIVELLKRRIE